MVENSLISLNKGSESFKIKNKGYLLRFKNNVNSMPLELVLKLISVFGLRIKNIGFGRVKLIKDGGVL